MAGSPTLKDLTFYLGVTEHQLQQRISDVHLGDIASALESWEIFARHVGLTTAEINGIKSDGSDYAVQKALCLETWKKKTFFHTYKALVEVCLKSKNAALAETIAKLAKESTPDESPDRVDTDSDEAPSSNQPPSDCSGKEPINKQGSESSFGGGCSDDPEVEIPHPSIINDPSSMAGLATFQPPGAGQEQKEEEVEEVDMGVPAYSEDDCVDNVMNKKEPKTPDAAMKKLLETFAKKIEIILHTCNDNEYWAAIERLDPPKSEEGENISDVPITFPRACRVVGLFAEHRVVIVRTDQGDQCHEPLFNAVKHDFPAVRIIVGAGIAYANHKSRKFADVLVSKHIENFVKYKIKEGKITNRGERPKVDRKCLDIFEANARDWSRRRSFKCTSGDKVRASQAHIGCIVSCPTLVSDKDFRDQLMKHTPDAIGGEMEGWVLLGLRKSLLSDRDGERNIGVIIIKAVVDYGDCSKGDVWQWTAAKAAMDCIHYCLKRTPEPLFAQQQ